MTITVRLTIQKCLVTCMALTNRHNYEANASNKQTKSESVRKNKESFGT